MTKSIIGPNSMKKHYNDTSQVCLDGYLCNEADLDCGDPILTCYLEL